MNGTIVDGEPPFSLSESSTTDATADDNLFLCETGPYWIRTLLYSSSVYIQEMDGFALPEVLMKLLEDVVLAMRAMDII